MKYEIVKERTIQASFRGKDYTLHRIRALVDIPHCNVVAGEYGGWVEHEGNLSQEGYGWIMHDARVVDSSCVHGNGVVVSDSAWIVGNSHLYDRVKVSGNAVVTTSRLKNDVKVTAFAKVYGSLLDGKFTVRGNARVEDSRVTSWNSIICDDVLLKDNRIYMDDSEISKNAIVMNSFIGKPGSSPAKHVLITDDVELYNVKSINNFSSVAINGDAYLKKVEIDAINASISGMTNLTGKLEMHLSVIRDSVTVSTDDKKLLLVSQNLGGDVKIDDENVHLYG